MVGMVGAGSEANSSEVRTGTSPFLSRAAVESRADYVLGPGEIYTRRWDHCL
jgi:hypothetical protein